MASACGGGVWTAAWLCEDAASPLTAAFGGVDLTEIASGGSPAYRVPGPLGDNAVRISVGATGFQSSSTSFLDVDNTKDICGVMVLRSQLPLSSDTFLLSKDDFVGGPGYELSMSSTAISFTADHSTPGNVIATATVPDSILTNNEWFVVMWAMERGTNSMRVAIQSLIDGASSVGALQSIASVGSISNTTPISIHRSGSFGNAFELAALYMGVGVGAAAGLTAGLAAALQGFCDTLRRTPLMSSYARMLAALLPSGKLWRLIGASMLYALLQGCAEELVRLHERVDDLLDEADPTTATELLPDFERALKLAPVGTLDERRARVVSRLVSRQRYRPVDFQNALAPLLGQAPANVVVIERTAAFAASIGDVREIFRFFIYRDPSLPGTYFLASAQEMVDKMKPSHTAGHVIESIDARYDSPFSLYDRDLLGA